jgi:hypothetical protein
VTAQTRHRSPFELLRFTASPVSVDLAVVELDGRFAQRGRFARQPVLVVEDGEQRVELAPVRAHFDGDRWRSVYAVPLGALDGGRFALGLRGTLLDLPTPDPADDADRFAALAREANRLRRALEAAENDAAAARAEAAAATAERGGAVTAARDAAEGAAAERIAALEAEVVAAHRTAAADAEERRAEAERALEAAVTPVIARAEAAEARVAELEGEVPVAEARGAASAEERVAAAEAGADERVATAEERVRAAQAALEAADAGIGVLRAELAEERERSQAAIADLQAQLEVARAGALSGDDDEDEDEDDDAEPGVPGHDDDDDATRDLADAPTAIRDPDEPPPTSLRPVTRDPEPVHRTTTAATPGLSPWIAVGALLLVAFVLLGLLFGFLG